MGRHKKPVRWAKAQKRPANKEQEQEQQLRCIECDRVPVVLSTGKCADCTFKDSGLEGQA
jgi:hypothetical protein